MSIIFDAYNPNDITTGETVLCTHCRKEIKPGEKYWLARNTLTDHPIYLCESCASDKAKKEYPVGV